MGFTHVLDASDIALLVPALDASLAAARRELGRGARVSSPSIRAG